MNLPDLWVVLDIGTTELKGALTNSQGEIEKESSRANQTINSLSGFEEQDAEKWWELVCEILSELGSNKKIEAIGITGQMQNLVLLDEYGELLHPAILYSDQRALAEVHELSEQDVFHEIKQKTGNEQGPSSVLCKLMWMKRNNSELYKKASKIMLGSADFISSKLTGKFFTDTTTASTTGLMHLSKRRWLDLSLFEKLALKDCVLNYQYLFQEEVKLVL